MKREQVRHRCRRESPGGIKNPSRVAGVENFGKPIEKLAGPGNSPTLLLLPLLGIGFFFLLNFLLLLQRDLGNADFWHADNR